MLYMYNDNISTLLCLDYLITNNQCVHNLAVVDERTRFFACIYMRAQRGISEWIEKTSHWKARRFDGENIVGLVGMLCGLYSSTGTKRIGDRKTERAFNEHELMSETNKHYTRVSLDQSWWKWLLVNEENVSRQSFPSCPLSHQCGRILPSK